MYDLVVIGGGSGGLNVATAAAKVGARVALIEKAQLGGEATLSACVPSKGLVQASRLLRQVRSAGSFGLKVGPVDVDFAAVMTRVRTVVQDLAREESADVLRTRGIDVFVGSAAFEAYDTIRIDGAKSVSGRRFVIATGSRPAVPTIPGLAEAGYLDDTTLWSLSSLPESLIIIGAGPAGIEFAQCFARFGSKVTILADSPRILPDEDADAADYVRGCLEADGVAFRMGVGITKVETRGDRKVCIFSDPAGGSTGEVAGAQVLVAAGRLARVEELNLEAIGVHADPQHGIEVDDFLQTHASRVYAIGDVLMRQQYTHAARREADIVFQNAVLRRRKRMNYETIPRATFSDPELAAVGITEERAGSEQPEFRVYRVPFAELDRARIDGRADGFAKVVATPGGRILGATIVGPDASLVIQEFILAFEKGLGLGAIAAATPIYPSYADAAQALADQHLATRLERGLIQTALKFFYGFAPRASAGNGTAHGAAGETPAPEEAAGHAAAGHGQGH
jgi:pyruvate/2-oxoglutarate dehydrogenase complex dihydrolipoamide dehydrogenase (E3) component